MEILKYIIPPLIGAVIGYFTNYIAVKMLFRPLYPIKIFGKKLPFTPGIIPKGKPRLAKALGKAVGTTLLTQEDIKNILLSESMKNTVKTQTEKVLQNDTSIKDTALKIVSNEKYIEIKGKICDKITDKVSNKIQEINLGQIIADKGQEAINEKIAGSMLGMFVKGDFISSICSSLGDKINIYIEQNGRYLIFDMIEKEVMNLEEKSLSEIADDNDFDMNKISEKVLQAYVSFIENHAEEFLKNFHISEIVENKVNEMDVLMLEELLMTIMKKELNAVVNLGAVIGLILGTINIFF